jgi:hypothetical protein
MTLSFVNLQPKEEWVDDKSFGRRAGGRAMNPVMLLTFRLSGFGWNGVGILLHTHAKPKAHCGLDKIGAPSVHRFLSGAHYCRIGPIRHGLRLSINLPNLWFS